MKLTDKVLMVSPDGFCLNKDTVSDNRFQASDVPENVRELALEEFSRMLDVLKSAAVTVHSFPSSEALPDAVFPNNWFTTHETGYCLYPMFAASRRLERQSHIIDFLNQSYQLLHDYSSFEDTDIFLEGTGSLILDRKNQMAFASKSKRTNEELFNRWCNDVDYTGVLFSAEDKDGHPIYHTNVLLALTPSYAVLCVDAITDSNERMRVVNELQNSQRKVLEISYAQLEAFCANIIVLKNRKDEPQIVLSETAYHAFTESQLEALSNDGELIRVSIPTIERIGGGSARCMIAELF